MSDNAIDSSYDYVLSQGHLPGDTRMVGSITQYLCFMRYHFTWRLDEETYPLGRSTAGGLFIQTVLGDCSNIILGKSEQSAHNGKTTAYREGVDNAIGGKLYWNEENPATHSTPDPAVTQDGGFIKDSSVGWS